MQSIPSTPVTPVITDQQLADWLRLDDLTDPLITPLATAATAGVIEYLNRNLITREFTLTAQDWPTAGTPTAGMSPSLGGFVLNILLPYSNSMADVANAVTAVTVNGDAYTDYNLRGDEIVFDGFTSHDDDEPAFVVVYDAGYSDIDAVPEAIVTAVTMVAAYMYEHRGMCTAADAINNTGAAMLLTPYRRAEMFI